MTKAREKRKLGKCVELLICGILFLITSDSGIIIVNDEPKCPDPQFPAAADTMKEMQPPAAASLQLTKYCFVVDPLTEYRKFLDFIYYAPTPPQQSFLPLRNDNNITLRELLRGDAYDDDEDNVDPTKDERYVPLYDAESYYIDRMLYDIAVYKDAIIEHILSKGVPYYNKGKFDAVLSASSL